MVASSSSDIVVRWKDIIELRSDKIHIRRKRWGPVWIGLWPSYRGTAGERDIVADPPQIILYGPQRVRIVFDDWSPRWLRRWWRPRESAFDRVLAAMTTLGMYTTDIS